MEKMINIKGWIPKEKYCQKKNEKYCHRQYKHFDQTYCLNVFGGGEKVIASIKKIPNKEI